MNQYITGSMIKKIREEKKITQAELAERLFVSEKTISKWETGRGYPDISIIEELAEALGISVIELMAGSQITNSNRAFNMKRIKLYVCPICGNIILSTGDTVISCCGITLSALEAEAIDDSHKAIISVTEDEYFIQFNHDMSRTHNISFAAAVSDNGVEIFKFYPEGNAECRFKIARTRYIYFYCNRHGLYKQNIK